MLRLSRATPRGNRRPVLIPLLALLVSFASLVPGGPIETRDFSGLEPAVYRGFNAFLTSLVLAGALAAWLVWKDRRAGYRLAIPVAWLFVAVVAMDLGRVFPVSPDPTGFVLGLILVVDGILAAYVAAFAHRALGRGP